MLIGVSKPKGGNKFHFEINGEKHRQVLITFNKESINFPNGMKRLPWINAINFFSSPNKKTRDQYLIDFKNTASINTSGLSFLTKLKIIFYLAQSILKEEQRMLPIVKDLEQEQRKDLIKSGKYQVKLGPKALEQLKNLKQSK